MNLHSLCVALFALSAVGAVNLVHARGETSDESALAVFESRIAPLAISANGQWRVHADSNNVLHRINLRDGKRAQQIDLLVDVYQVAASRTAQKVAFTSSLGCVGVVDFGSQPGLAPKLRWISTTSAGLGAKVKFLEGEQRLTTDCKADHSRSVIAISTDGKLVADVENVYDLETQTVAATLPSSVNDIGQRRTLNIQFTDNNTKLFLATATLGAGYEGGGGPSDMQFSIWDLRRKTLFNLAGGSRPEQFVPEMFLYSYSAQTGTLNFVNADRYLASREKLATNGENMPLLDVIQSNFHTCQTKLTNRLPLTPWQWIGYVVDPLGRWIAGIREFDNTASAGTGSDPKGVGEELRLIDIRSGRLIEAIPLRQALHGLVATPDGSAIFGITPLPIDPATVDRVTTDSGRKPGRDVLQINVHPDALTLAKDEGNGFPADPCKIENEIATARIVDRTTRLLKPLWTRQIASLTDIQRVMEEKLKTKSDPSHTTSEPVVCNALEAHGMSFKMQDQTLWLDKHAEIVQLEWSTGRALKSFPTPRKRNVCSTPMPEAGGFINYQGDTVSFQAFESLSSPNTKKQIIDVKRGWYASNVSWSPGIQVTSRTFDVIWQAKPETTLTKDKYEQLEDMLISTYDVVSKQRIGEVATQADSYDMGGWNTGGYADAPSALGCESQWSEGKKILGFENSYFDSFRAYQCVDLKNVETVFWAGLDIAPKQPENSRHQQRLGSGVLAFGGSIGIAIDEAGLIHVFDVIAKRELAQIQPTAVESTQQVRLSESEGTVVLESLDYVGDNYVRNLRAYSFK